MNIVALLTTYRPLDQNLEKGGGEISNIQLLEWLSNNGHKITVFALNSDYLNKREINGIYVFGNTRNARFSTNKILDNFFYFKKIKDNIKLSNIDLIISSTETISYANKISEKYLIPTLSFVRSYENFKNKASFKKKIKNLFFGDFFEKGLSRIDYLVCNSLYMKRFVENNLSLQKLPKIGVVYPPVEVRCGLFDKAKKDTIIMVGTNNKKGICLFGDLAKKFPDKKFEIIGAHKNLSIVSSENLVVSGWCDVINKFKNNALLVLVPSQWDEPFGRVAVEAILCNVPVFVADRGGLPEAVDFNEIRIVKGGAQNWKEKIEDFFLNQVKYEVSDDEKFILENKYSIKVQGTQLERYLEGIVKK